MDNQKNPVLPRSPDSKTSPDLIQQLYEFGREIREYPRYQNCHWHEIEQQAILEVKTRFPDTQWETVREVVKAGWEEAQEPE